jgi:hypothetical protein
MEIGRKTNEDDMKVPRSMMFDLAVDHWRAIVTTSKITGHRSSTERLVTNAFVTGFRRGVEAASKGELIVENDALHNAFVELNPGQKQIIALRELLSDVIYLTVDHAGQCDCEVCQALQCYEERAR